MPSVKSGDTIRFLKSFSYGDVQYEPESTTQVGVRMNAKSASLAVRAGVAEVVPVPALVATPAPKVLEPSPASSILPAVPIPPPPTALAVEPEVIEALSPLNQEESAVLGRLEVVVEKHIMGFKEAGIALTEISKRKLYRAEYTSFSAYLEGRWKMHRAQAYRLMSAAPVALLLSPMGDSPSAVADAPVPTSERQVRPLVGMESDEQQQAWDVACAAAGGDPTGEQVSRAARKVRGETEEPEEPTCSLALEMPADELPGVKKLLKDYGFKSAGGGKMRFAEV